jgi:putative acyl-CoA dehydrogenase
MMRRVVAEAIWHARHRAAFGAPLAQQPAMLNVLADLALESEAATASVMRIARAFDSEDPQEAAFRRLALAVMKYWVCKRGAPLAAEALECLGGNGYVEEAPMAQFYRDIQIGTVWEGSGNVIALDVLRALAREPEGAPAFLAQCELAAGAHAGLTQTNICRPPDPIFKLSARETKKTPCGNSRSLDWWFRCCSAASPCSRPAKA